MEGGTAGAAIGFMGMGLYIGPKQMGGLIAASNWS